MAAGSSYTPLSSREFTPGVNADIWLLGITFVEISAVAAAVEIIVTILKVRAAGMTLAKMPLIAWYLLVHRPDDARRLPAADPRLHPA